MTIYIPHISNRKDNIMSSSVGSNESSFGNGPPQVSPPAFSGDVGGAIKPSQILGSIGVASGAAGALLPFTAPITIPLGILSGLAGSIAGLFGGGLTEMEVKMLMEIKERVDQRRNLKGVVGSPAN